MATLCSYAGASLHLQLVVHIILLASITDNVQASENVPDNTVWTPPTATFFYGQPKANITCKFRGIPYAVYWMKGSTADTATTLISKVNGVTKRPASDAGSLDINDEYTLIFNNIQAGDAGNYICRVSNHRGFLIVNNTAVRVLDPDVVSIFTEPNMTGWAGFSINIQCTFVGTPERVLWNRAQKNSKINSVETVMRYTTNGYEVLGDRRYTWSKSYGLIIKDLEIMDEGNFTCMVSKPGGTEIENTTVLNVNARALKPYIQIPGCRHDPEREMNQSTPEPCEIKVSKDEEFFNLQCSVIRAKPQVDLLWQDMQGGSRNLTKLKPIITARKDGGFDAAVTLTRPTNQTSTHPMSFKCLASGIAVDGTAEQTVIVQIIEPKAPPSKMKGPPVEIIFIVIIFLAVLVFLIFIVVRWWQYHKSQTESGYSEVESQANGEPRSRFGFRLPLSKDCISWMFCCGTKVGLSGGTDLEEVKGLTAEETELKELREKLEKYRPGRLTGLARVDIPDSSVHIGVFGVMGAGKSSFINSLNFALTNEYKNVSIEADREQGGSETKFRDVIQLTEYIHVVDNRGMMDLNIKQIEKDLMPQIRGKRGLNPQDKVKGGKKIHCPVIVCDPSGPVKFDDTLRFISAFTQAVNDSFGRHLMVVITHENKLRNPDMPEGPVSPDSQTVEDVVEKIKQQGGVPKNYIQIFENYTAASHEPDVKRSTDYLKFLVSCLDTGERNIRFRLDHEGERTSIWSRVRKSLSHSLRH
ncbi:uncharacterized protein LOC121420209 [Lytechinus variegatus]|uniref:uncharacterized protein LOC121420209 n=1 Tax=Lytechinus variegatus TaxID=7654 RepID=UPI001BB132C6|nr:uncharacterized protein LOC121420209 [Lytechinus variegatus]